VVSVEQDTALADTNVNFYVGNTKRGTTVTMTDVTNIDLAAYETYVGLRRLDSSGKTGSTTDMFHGFVRSLVVYQTAHVTTNEDHIDGGTCGARTCWTVDFDSWSADGTTPTACRASCKGKGCARDEECGTCDNHAYCHICLDIECEACTTYSACSTTSCNSTRTT
jgi:hypothetical protein